MSYYMLMFFLETLLGSMFQVNDLWQGARRLGGFSPQGLTQTLMGGIHKDR